MRRLARPAAARSALADLARVGVALDPGLLLAALAARRRPGVDAGHRFTVAYDVAGDGALDRRSPTTARPLRRRRPETTRGDLATIARRPRACSRLLAGPAAARASSAER